MHGRLAALATTAFVLICAGLLAGATVAPEGAPAPPTAAPATSVQIENALLTEMNRVRARHGRVPLRSLSTLRRPARDQSRYLVSIDELRHESSDGSPFWTRLVAAGFPRGRMMGENIAMVSGCGRGGARRTVAMWMNSPGHRANLLNRRFRWAGPGVALGAGCSSTYLTADYGS